MFWFAAVTVWVGPREWRPATMSVVHDALTRVREGKNDENWSEAVDVKEVPGTVGCFLITIPPRWEAALRDPADGYVEIEVKSIPRVGTVKFEINRGLQMELVH